jgi:hypothetical protein
MNTRFLSLIAFFLLSFTLKANAANDLDARLNFGAGFGTTTLEYGTSKKFEPQSLGGHIDLYAKWKFLLLGGSYTTISQLVVDDNRAYFSMATANIGLALGRLELVGGYGAGKFRRVRMNEITTPNDSDYIGVGPGFMAGVRLHLIKLKNFSIGLSGTYYQVKTDDYASVEDGTKATVSEKSTATGTLAAIVFSWGKVPKN